jgi:RNA polymerase primary sigma factor
MTRTETVGPRSLKEWEEWLEPQVRQVELLGEVPVTSKECTELGRALGLRLKAIGLTETIDVIRTKYPLAFAVYLVAQGVYGFEEGDYWSSVCELTGVAHGYTYRWGQLFEEILDDRGLPLFHDLVASGANRYISVILAHGGIPNYCLPDFFKNVLQPSIVQPEFVGLSPSELIDEWQWQSRVQYFTDKPVIRFLIYGGHVAEDWVQRCREMAQRYLDSGAPPDPEEVGLPSRVVEAYRDWIEAEGADQVRRPTGDQWQLRRPQIRVDPWGEGVILDLPPQQVPATRIHASICWRVTIANTHEKVAVRTRKSGFDWKTAPDSVPLTQPAPEYKVSLLADGELRREWVLPGVVDKQPLMVFDPGSGLLISWHHTLPARSLGLLYPRSLGLRVQGEARLLEELPRLPWEWANYRGQIWDLGGAKEVVLLGQGPEPLRVAVRADEALNRPRLEGGQQLVPGCEGVHAGVYVGLPPKVRIPRTERLPLAEDLARWRVTVQSEWTAIPAVETSRSLSELGSGGLAVTGQYVDLTLHHPNLLGPSPFGNYVVRLRGPLGRSAEFRLRILPYLAVSGHETVYLPDTQGNAPQPRLRVRTSAGDDLQCGVDNGECRVEETASHPGYRGFEIHLDAAATEVQLTIARNLPAGDVARVLVPVRIERLCWMMAEEGSSLGAREWTSRPRKQPFDALLQAVNPCLLVRLPSSSEASLGLTLRLLDVDGTELQKMERAAPRRGQEVWRFDLSAFLDTLRAASRSSVLRFELEAHGLPELTTAPRWVVLSVTRQFVVRDITLKSVRVDDQVLYNLRWVEPVPLKNRVVRFWSVWRAWSPPIHERISDEAQGHWEFQAAQKSFPTGKYRVEFAIEDPWVPSGDGQPPSKGAPGTAEIQLISPQARLQEIDGELQRNGDSFSLHLERAIVSLELGQTDRAKEETQWCFDHLDDAGIGEVLSLVHCVAGIKSDSTCTALRMKMFAPRRLERLIQSRAEGKISHAQFEDYIANRPPAGVIGPPALKQLLEVDDDGLRLWAAEQLMGKGEVCAIDAVLKWADAGRLSDSDALSLLRLKPMLAVDGLWQCSNRPAAQRLLPALEQTLESIVRVGGWVHCDFGWGRVESIEHIASGRQVQWCIGALAKSNRYQLRVALHPTSNPEVLAVDLQQAMAVFGNWPHYVCGWCNRFSTQSWAILAAHCRSAHPRESRGGHIKGRGVNVRATPLSFIECTARPPRDELS